MQAYDFETNIEETSIDFLSQATGLSVNSFYASLGQETFVSPRISVRCEIQGADDPPTKNDIGDFEYSQFNASFSISIISDASVDATQVDHRSYRTAARKAMLLNSANWSGAAISANGSGASAVNAGFNVTGVDNGKDEYRSANGAGSKRVQIRWSGTQWDITLEDSGSSQAFYSSTEDALTPDLVTTWTIEADGSSPTPSFTTGWNPLPYYEVKYVKPAGTDFEVDGDLAISTLTYDMKFTINPSAY